MNSLLKIFYPLRVNLLIIILFIGQDIEAQNFLSYKGNPFGIARIQISTSVCFVDIDADNDLDFFVPIHTGDFIFQENIGSRSTPIYDTVQVTPFGLVTQNHPLLCDFGDLDNDGDYDLIVGSPTGELEYFENIGTPTTPLFTNPVLQPFGLTQNFYPPAPKFGDFDNDGDLDLMVFERSDDDLFIFENTGTVNAPFFNVNQPMYHLITEGAFASAGDLDLDGDLDIILGTTSTSPNTFLYHENTGSSIIPQFAPGLQDPFGLNGQFDDVYPVFADLDCDGDQDLFCIDDDDSDLFYYELTNVTGCGFVPVSDITSMVSNHSAILMTQLYSNSLHQFRYREIGNSVWIYLAATNLPNEVATGLQACTEYEVQLRVNCNGEWTGFSCGHFFMTTGTTSSINVLLEGPTDVLTGQMNADLYDLGLLPGMTPLYGTPTPSSHPYSGAPWNYTGTEGQGFVDADYQSVYTTTGLKPVDWVLLSFRAGIGAITEVDQTAALLLEDGSIHFVDDCLDLNINQNYYIVLEHRNHLGIMSLAFVNYFNNSFSLTFYTQDSYSINQPGTKLLNNGKWAMFTSDANASGNINASDRSAIWNARNQQGYLPEDTNLDGRVDAADRSNSWNNRNHATQVPQ